MTLHDYVNSKIPEYSKTMYLEGYSPQQILTAVRNKMLRDMEERQEDTENTFPDINIISEVRIR